jgi:hypothetical protein
MAALVLSGIAAALTRLLLVLVRGAMVMVRHGHVIVHLRSIRIGGRDGRAARKAVRDRGHSLDGNHEQQGDQQVAV